MFAFQAQHSTHRNCCAIMATVQASEVDLTSLTSVRQCLRRVGVDTSTPGLQRAQRLAALVERLRPYIVQPDSPPPARAPSVAPRQRDSTRAAAQNATGGPHGSLQEPEHVGGGQRSEHKHQQQQQQQQKQQQQQEERAAHRLVEPARRQHGSATTHNRPRPAGPPPERLTGVSARLGRAGLDASGSWSHNASTSRGAPAVGPARAAPSALASVAAETRGGARQPGARGGGAGPVARSSASGTSWRAYLSNTSSAKSQTPSEGSLWKSYMAESKDPSAVASGSVAAAPVPAPRDSDGYQVVWGSVRDTHDKVPRNAHRDVVAAASSSREGLQRHDHAGSDHSAPRIPAPSSSGISSSRRQANSGPSSVGASTSQAAGVATSDDDASSSSEDEAPPPPPPRARKPIPGPPPRPAGKGPHRSYVRGRCGLTCTAGKAHGATWCCAQTT